MIDVSASNRRKLNAKTPHYRLATNCDEMYACKAVELEFESDYIVCLYIMANVQA